MRAVSHQIFTLLILNGLERALQVEPLVGLALDVVRDHLALLHDLKLLSDAVADVSTLRLVDLDRFLHVRDLRGGSIDVLCSQVSVVVFLDDRLDEDLGLRAIYLTYLHQVAPTHSPHDICRVHRIGVLLVVLLPSNNIILEELLIFIIDLVLVVTFGLRTLYVLDINRVSDRWGARQVGAHLCEGRYIGCTCGLNLLNRIVMLMPR